MSETDTAIAELNQPTAAPASPRPAAIPYLSIAGAREAIAWYTDAFGASLVGQMYEMDDGRVGHDGRERAVPPQLLAAEGQSPAVEPARAGGRGQRASFEHLFRVHVGPVRRVQPARV